MNVIWFVWILVQLLIGYNLVLPFLLFILSLFKKYKARLPVKTGNDYGIIVTAYEQITLIPAVVTSLLSLNYKNYTIYVVADNCDISTLHFDDERVVVLRPEQILSSNTRSHFYAIRHFKRPHNILTIIDSDNLVHSEYLNELDRFFDQGFTAVQGVREAKNLNTNYACLDAARDIYYHFYDGKILFNVGSSATLAGSGMAFTTQLYRDCLESLDVTGAGFDKVLQHAILTRKQRIAFSGEAIVYDEKTSRPDQLVKQRSRWINTWFKYFGFGFDLILKGVTNFSWNQLLFGLILLRPPLFIFLILSAGCMFIDLFISLPMALMWLGGFALFVLGFYIALAKSDTDKRIYRSLKNIPLFVFFQVLSLLKVRKANQHSVATTHYYDGDDTPSNKQP